MSPKYRQRGYQEEEPREKSSRRLPGVPPERDGPRGRGLGSPTQSAFRCSDCGARQDSVEVAQDSRCPACGKPLHNCVNCRHFDSSSRFECRQDLEIGLPSKLKKNQCSYFAAKLVAEQARESTPREPSDAKSAFDALFKGI